MHRPRQWGACWLACPLYEQLGLDHFWQARLPDSREGTCWRHILETLVCYRLIGPGSEWRLHRLWFEQSALGDLLGADYSLVEKNALYRCLDQVLSHKRALFGQLTQRWQDLFGVRFDLRIPTAGGRTGQAPPRLQPRQAARLRASRHCLGPHPGGFPPRLRSAGGKHPRQDHAQAVLADDRSALWQSRARLGDGPRDSHRRSPRGNARGRSTRLLPGWYAPGQAHQTGTRPPLPWATVRPGVNVKLLPQDGANWMCLPKAAIASTRNALCAGGGSRGW